MRRFLPLFILLVAAACSTTRVLEEGEYRLTRNDIDIEGPVRFPENELNAYIRQDAQGWSPLLCIYNWSRRDGLLHKIGRAPVVFDSTAVKSTCDNIATRMEYLGYYGSKVTGKVSYHGKKKVRVSYNVKPGRSYRILNLRYDIPAGGDFPGDFYADTLTASALVRGEWLSEKLLESETERSASRLRNMGYFDFNKNNYSFEADTLADGTATLIYRINEYTRNETPSASRPLRRYFIGEVSISRPATLPFREKPLRELGTIHPGDLYSETSVANTYARFSNIKVFNSVQVQMTPSDTNRVDCGITLSQSPVQGFKIKAEGSSNSTGLMGFSPQVSFYHKNFFHGGEWFNLAFSGDFQYRVSDRTRAIEYGISAGLSLPKFLGLPYRVFKGPRIPRTEINAAYNYQDRPEYNREAVSAAFGYSGVTGGNISYKVFPLRANMVRLFNLDSRFENTLSRNPFMKYAYQNHLDAGLGADFYYNSSEDIVPQGSYMFRRLSIDLSGNLISLFNGLLEKSGSSYLIAGVPYSQYIRGEYSWGRTRRYGEDNRQAVAMRLLGGIGYAYGNSSALPFEKQFYAGGASSMRGWQARALGPGAESINTYFSIPSQTGDIKLEANFEYRFGIVWKFEGALFADVGNVWALTWDSPEGRFTHEFYKTLGADWGAGLRLNMQFILVRVDFGMQLYDPSKPEGSRLIGAGKWLSSGNNAVHFGIGYPF